MPAFDVGMFLLGCCGGLLPDVLRLIKNRNEEGILTEFRNVKYWITLVLQILLGGLAAYVISAATAKDALILGYTAPEVIGALVAKPADKPVVKGEKKEFNIRAWLAK